jgi:hypothetical protein
MANLTLSIEPETVKRVRKIALERNTSLTAMVRDYLHQVASSDEEARRRAGERLEESFKKYSRNFGPRDWKRDDLYDR